MNLLKAASTVSLLTLASRITGLVRELLVAATFGANATTDAFNVAAAVCRGRFFSGVRADAGRQSRA
jgi:peptidoglycan biosynthesis protein MviN/MurJ (putative lipid II flippase)